MLVSLVLANSLCHPAWQEEMRIYAVYLNGSSQDNWLVFIAILVIYSQVEMHFSKVQSFIFKYEPCLFSRSFLLPLVSIGNTILALTFSCFIFDRKAKLDVVFPEACVCQMSDREEKRPQFYR